MMLISARLNYILVLDNIYLSTSTVSYLYTIGVLTYNCGALNFNKPMIGSSPFYFSSHLKYYLKCSQNSTRHDGIN